MRAWAPPFSCEFARTPERAFPASVWDTVRGRTAGFTGWLGPCALPPAGSSVWGSAGVGGTIGPGLHAACPPVRAKGALSPLGRAACVGAFSCVGVELPSYAPNASARARPVTGFVQGLRPATLLISAGSSRFANPPLLREVALLLGGATTLRSAAVVGDLGSCMVSGPFGLAPPFLVGAHPAKLAGLGAGLLSAVPFSLGSRGFRVRPPPRLVSRLGIGACCVVLTICMAARPSLAGQHPATLGARASHATPAHTLPWLVPCQVHPILCAA